MKELCTYKVNQDPLELFFAQVRSLGGPNNHPRAADFCSRFRTLSMCSNSVVDNVLTSHPRLRLQNTLGMLSASQRRTFPTMTVC